MPPSDETSARWLAALQQGVPLTARPLFDMAERLGTDAESLEAFVSGLRAGGLLRRFGGVFDARRIGYSSALCCAETPPEETDAAGARIAALESVTHCYRRDGGPGLPNLWFVAVAREEGFAEEIARARAAAAPWGVSVLPALRRYKVDVMFGVQRNACDAWSAGDMGTLPALDAKERALAAVLAGDTAFGPDFWENAAARAGISPGEALDAALRMREKGAMKRIALLLRHRRAGWTANAMCAWRVDGDTAAAGRALAACPETSHCYERPFAPHFPYNLYAMIHARDAARAREQFERISKAAGLSEGTMLPSTMEYKKSSAKFFCENLSEPPRRKA